MHFWFFTQSISIRQAKGSLYLLLNFITDFYNTTYLSYVHKGDAKNVELIFIINFHIILNFIFAHN